VPEHAATSGGTGRTWKWEGGDERGRGATTAREGVGGRGEWCEDGEDGPVVVVVVDAEEIVILGDSVDDSEPHGAALRESLGDDDVHGGGGGCHDDDDEDAIEGGIVLVDGPGRGRREFVREGPGGPREAIETAENRDRRGL